MEVSIVIVNYNGRNLLKACLNSINRLLKKNYEVIVVDNNSNDDSIEFLKKNYKNVRVIENKKNLGYSGINSALPYCKSKYILFLNNDIIMEKNCIYELLKAIKQDNKIGMAAPKLVNYYNKNLSSGGTWLSRSFYNGHIPGNENINEIPYMGVGLIRKDLVKKFGYIFDPDYFIYAEDVDLGLRLRIIGCKMVFVPSAIIYHMHAMTTKSMGSYTTFLLERNLLMTFLKILSLKNIIFFLPYVLFMRIIAMSRDVVTFKFSILFSRLKAFLWIVLNFNVVYKKRKKMQKLRKAEDDFILKVFSERYLLKKRIIL